MSQNAYERAMNAYVVSPQGKIDLFFMAQDQASRVGPAVMKREAKQAAWNDVDAVERKQALEKARASGDVEAQNRALIAMGMAADSDMGQAPAKAETSDIDKKLDSMVEAINMLVNVHRKGQEGE